MDRVVYEKTHVYTQREKVNMEQSWPNKQNQVDLT